MESLEELKMELMEESEDPDEFQKFFKMFMELPPYLKSVVSKILMARIEEEERQHREEEERQHREEEERQHREEERQRREEEIQNIEKCIEMLNNITASVENLCNYLGVI